MRINKRAPSFCDYCYEKVRVISMICWCQNNIKSKSILNFRCTEKLTGKKIEKN